LTAENAEPAGRARLHVQLFRFVVTGVLSAIVDFGLLVVLMNLAHLGHTPAKALSFIAGTATAYLINRRWTFAAEPSKRRFVAVMALYGITFAVQVGLFAVLFPWAQRVWGDLVLAQVDDFAVTVPQLVGFVIAQGVATAVNFVVQRAVIFR
jgi:putative flippase GtrA